jgi:hypothetical protein
MVKAQRPQILFFCLYCSNKSPLIMLVYVLLVVYLVCLYMAYKGAATSEK